MADTAVIRVMADTQGSGIAEDHLDMVMVTQVSILHMDTMGAFQVVTGVDRVAHIITDKEDSFQFTFEA